MISFACKQIDFKELVQCSFELNKTEYDLFMFLLSSKENLCVSSISKLLKKDRTTIQKAVKKLLQKELVLKHQVNLENGGYVYVYNIRDKQLIRNKLLNIVESWYKQVVNYVDKW